MNRGDIWQIDLGGRIGTRPVVILTRQNVLRHLNKVTVAEVTSRGKGYPAEVFIGQESNLARPSFVQADNLHTLPKARLQKRPGRLGPDTMLRRSGWLWSWKPVSREPDGRLVLRSHGSRRFWGPAGCCAAALAARPDRLYDEPLFSRSRGANRCGGAPCCVERLTQDVRRIPVAPGKAGRRQSQLR